MQGKQRTPKTDDLAFIFFKIRETRDDKTRRSWQRRARLALAKRDDLTAAERHEVCAVWSRFNCDRVNSPAMSKCRGVAHAPRDYQTITAKSCTRRRFDAPSVYCSVSHNSHGLDSGLHHLETYTRHDVLFLCALLLARECTFPHLHRGSVGHSFLNDSRNRQRRLRERLQTQKRPPPKPKIDIYSKSALSKIRTKCAMKQRKSRL